jgi:hypothetical protein
MISEKFEAGTTVKDELSVTHPGTYILRWDNTHSRMRGKQIQCERIPRPSLPLLYLCPLSHSCLSTHEPRGASHSAVAAIIFDAAVGAGISARFGQSPRVQLR